MSVSKRKRQDDVPETSSKMSRLAMMPKLKIFHWSGYTPPLDPKSHVYVRDATVTVADKCIFETTELELDKTLTHRGYISVDAWVEKGDSENSLMQSFLLDPPTVPLPAVLIRVQLSLDPENTEFDQYLIILVPLGGVSEILCDEQVMVDSSAALRRLAIRLLHSTKVRDGLRPCLQEFGISMSALTPYTLIF